MNAIRFDHVFHPSDFSEGDSAAFAHALRIALAAKGKLSLLHVNSPGEPGHWSDFPSVRRILSDWSLLPRGATFADMEQLGLEVKKIQRTGSRPAEEIISYAREHAPDLLVAATHQRQGLNRLLHPSLALETAEGSQGMTLFVPRRVAGFVSVETGVPRLRQVLVPVEHTPNANRAVDAAVALCRTLSTHEAHITLLHVGKQENAPVVRIPDRPGISFEKAVWEGDVVENILSTSEAQDIDLIVMATHPRHGLLGAARGSTTARVLRSAKCPVLAVPEF